jgi:hypothetical protein
MPGVSSSQAMWLLDVADRMAGRGPLAGALAITGEDDAEVAALDQRLLELRAQLFGRTLDAVALCPACGEELELELDTQQLAADTNAVADELTLRRGGWEVVFRMPTATDLAAVTGLGDTQQARSQLASACVITAQHHGVAPAPGKALPETVVAEMAKRMADRDPLGGSRVAFACPACGDNAEPAVDVAWLVTRELCAAADRLADDVHALASAYGWTEAEVLSLSPARRERYLERVGT